MQIFTALNPDVDYSQENLIKQFQQYTTKVHKGELLLNTQEGLCAGLVAYWLYLEAMGKGMVFWKELEHAYNWDSANLLENPAPDAILEKIFNGVGFLQHDILLRDNINQDDLQQSFDFLLDIDLPRMQPAEFKILFVFNRDSLQDLITKTVLPNKMIRFDNGLHAIGLIFSDGVYHLYDPNAKHGLQSFTAVPDLVNAIFSGLSKYCRSTNYISLYMAVFDLEGAQPQTYLVPMQFCKALLLDADYKTATLRHPNIFHLAMRHFDCGYTIMDELFTAGYKYLPWKLNRTTEYEEAVISNDFKKLAYLVQHDIPIDYKSSAGYGITPLAKAVVMRHHDMLFALLAAGANPNVKASQYVSLLDFALEKDNKPALILLLANGLNVSDLELKQLHEKYPVNVLEEIIARALKINQLLLPVPPEKFSAAATDQEMESYLMHEKLKVQMHPDAELTQEFIAIIDTIIPQITSKPITEHSRQELLEIRSIALILEGRFKPSHHLYAKVSAASSTITQYLINNGVTDLSAHIANLNLNELYKKHRVIFSSAPGVGIAAKEPELSFSKDILPLLSF